MNQYEGPFEDVPDWMFGPLWAWAISRYPIREKGMLRTGAVAEYRRIGMALRLSLDSPRIPNPTDAAGLQAVLYGLAFGNRPLLLDVIDFWLSQSGQAPSEVMARDRLESTLTAGGSVYRVESGERYYLGRRVAPAVQQAADQLRTGGRSGEHLSRAWQSVFGRDPNPSEGYRESIKAVEAAAIPVVSPTNGRATLGTVIADIRNDPTKWTITLHSSTPDEQVPALRGMLELLWKGQNDRHGTPDPATVLDVSQEDAEAALHLALTLVHWFSAGVVTAR